MKKDLTKKIMERTTKTRASFRLNTHIFERFKKFCFKKKISQGDLISELMKVYLQERDFL